jgi:hypothetical protein
MSKCHDHDFSWDHTSKHLQEESSKEKEYRTSWLLKDLFIRKDCKGKLAQSKGHYGSVEAMMDCF